MFVEAPNFINNKCFAKDPRENVQGGTLADSLDYNVYQDPFFKFEDISEQNHAFFNDFGGVRVAYLAEKAGERCGVDFNI